jgi:hypothetical protein
VKAGVWCALSARRIVGPVFFNETINCERYVWINLRQFFLKLTEEERPYGCFQQVSATAHTARMCMQALSDVFGDRIISSDIRPARSPDLNSCDIFFCGCLKGKVYSSNPRMEEGVKENIRKEISNIPAEHLQKVNQNLYASARNVFVYRDSIFNTSCDL